MHDWDGKERTASRRSLFYYNSFTKRWRAEVGDIEGTNSDGINTTVFSAWACHFQDGIAVNWDVSDKVDFSGTARFGLVSWNNDNYIADCKLTIID